MTFFSPNHESTCNCDICKMYNKREYFLFDALRNGKSLTNGPQVIWFSSEENKGYLTCYDPDCCYLEFEGLYEILIYIKDADDWEIV